MAAGLLSIPSVLQHAPISLASLPVAHLPLAPPQSEVDRVDPSISIYLPKQVAARVSGIMLSIKFIFDRYTFTRKGFCDLFIKYQQFIRSAGLAAGNPLGRTLHSTDAMPHISVCQPCHGSCYHVRTLLPASHHPDGGGCLLTASHQSVPVCTGFSASFRYPRNLRSLGLGQRMCVDFSSFLSLLCSWYAVRLDSIGMVC